MPKNWADSCDVGEDEGGGLKVLDWLYLRCTVFAIRFDEIRASNKKGSGAGVRILDKVRRISVSVKVLQKIQ